MRTAAVAAAAVSCLFCLLPPQVIAEGPAASAPATATASTAPARAKITISKETTYFLGPVREDGTINYVKAINDRMAEGVTPENNAAVVLLRVFDPKTFLGFTQQPHMAGVYERVLKRMDAEPPPADTKFYVLADTFFANDPEARGPSDGSAPASLPASAPDITPEMLRAMMNSPQPRYTEWVNKAMEGPWAEKDLPGIARWLKANEKPLDTIAEASRRPRYFVPLVPGGGRPEMISALIPSLAQYRDAARALLARSMLKLGKGDIDGAHADLMTIHRFARLASQDVTVIGQLVALAIDVLGCNGDKALVGSGKLTAKQAHDMADELAKLPPIGRMAESIDMGERCTNLDVTQTLFRMPLREFLDTLTSVSGGRRFDKPSADTRLPFDVNVMLRNANKWFDRYREATRKATFAERKASLGEIEHDLKELSKRMSGMATPGGVFKWLAKVAAAPEAKKKEVVSQDLSDLLLSILMPALNRAFVLQDRARQELHVATVAAALAAYKAEKGSYPKALAELAPKHLKSLPTDIFSGKGLIYRADAKSFIVYSIGENLQDDGGSTQKDGMGFDDIAAKAGP